ncbi:MAG: hypothetical protein EPN69_07615 [Rhodanobacter sp.]|nr:MAG: hypothetical protein EPN69_07615 [Rhodanobacter sp.]TAM40692.1 MAG: hypothetical protein EPN58_09515 [Rhodanobacter sp.]TAN22831.1 MAG: hypothetical protein EPN32_12430 [Rhodanobacter sp.]
MKRSSLTTRLAQAAGLASMLLLAACGKHETPAPTAPSAASSMAPTATVAIATSAPAPASSAKPEATPARTGTSAVNTPAPATSAVLPFRFGKLTLGDAVNADHEITHAVDHFAADDKTLYASVATVGRSTGATLNAKWRYLEGRGQLVSSISQSVATDGPAITTFKVQNPDLWPEGKYKVEISIDGKPVASQDFRIGKR